jgi:hypothetical protein
LPIDQHVFFCFFSLIDWILSNAIKRLPILGESEYDTLITGADSFTPDGRLILNESAEVCYFFMNISFDLIEKNYLG